MWIIILCLFCFHECSVAICCSFWSYLSFYHCITFILLALLEKGIGDSLFYAFVFNKRLQLPVSSLNFSLPKKKKKQVFELRIILSDEDLVFELLCFSSLYDLRSLDWIHVFLNRHNHSERLQYLLFTQISN